MTENQGVSLSLSKAGKIGRALILPGFDKLNLTAVP